MYSLPFVAGLWALVGIVGGWIWASRADYRDPAVITWGVTMPARQPEKPVAACTDHWVGTAKVPVWNTVSARSVAPYVGVASSTIIRTRIKRHAVNGPSCYEPRTRTMLELVG